MISVSPATDPKVNRRMVTATVIGASVLQILDTTIANVALPHMQGTFSASQDQVVWVLTSYIVAAAVMTPLTGWLAGAIGRKRLFLYSVVAFTIASALCGMAQSLEQMVLFRMIQGIAGAALVPMSQAVIFDINPPERHNKAMANWGLGIILAPILGPIVGGWLTEEYSWRWVFYINVPLGALATLGVLRYMPDAPRSHSQFDFFGFSSLAIAIAAFQLLLDRGQLNDWFQSTETIVEATTAGLALYFFVVHSATSARPFFRPALFRDRNFMSGNFASAVLTVVMFASLALLPPLMQNLLQYPVITAGFLTAPRGIGGLISMMLVGYLLARLDVRAVIALGLLLTASATWIMTGYSLTMDRTPFIWAGILQSLGSSIAFLPLTSLTFATLAPDLRNQATAFYSLSRNIGGSVGISIVQTLLARNSQVAHANLAEHITRFASTPEWIRLSLNNASGLARIDGMVNMQASMIAYLDDFVFMLILTLLVLPLLLLLRMPKNMPVDEPAHLVVE